MEKKDYQKLNNYLNQIFMILSDYDYFLIKNIDKIARLNSKYLSFIEKYDLNSSIKDNKLTYEDVYLIAREIIASIDKSYLNDYDNLIKSGQLDFGYEEEYDDSEFVHEHNLINIRREFNYNDVISLVHEFIHFTNGKAKKSQNRYLLTEFLSIYFEIYALDYLMEQGIPENEVGIYDRLKWTRGSSITLSRYEIIFLAYEKFGNINEETYTYLNKYYLAMSKEEFDRECQYLLDYIIKKEDEYKTNITFEKEFIYDFCSPFFDNYRYFLGTLLAFYSRKYSKIEDIVYLNNHINDCELGEIKLSKVLKKIGIDINDSDFEQQIFDSIDSYIKEYSNEKSR